MAIQVFRYREGYGERTGDPTNGHACGNQLIIITSVCVPRNVFFVHDRISPRL